MRTSNILAAVIAVAIAGGAWWWLSKSESVSIISNPVQISVPGAENNGGNLSADYKNAAYIIEGQPITLEGGKAEILLDQSSVSKISVQYFGNEAFGDLDGDGVPDAAFLLTQTGGGTGTFYYAVAALKTPDGYQGTNGIFIGDRIAPQATEIKNRQVIINYAERNPGEPMTAKPSVGVSKYLEVVFGELQESAPVAN